MPNYRRAFQPGGMYFFTLVTECRRPLFADERNRHLLHSAFDSCCSDYPFELVAIVLLPDHLHTLWTLPHGDANFSRRWARIKASFTRAYLDAGGADLPTSRDRARHREHGVWQRRFWEHLIRDEDDLNGHLDYIHYNPVKHGLANCPHAWPFSSFARFVSAGGYPRDWNCTCHGRKTPPPSFDGVAGVEMD